MDQSSNTQNRRLRRSSVLLRGTIQFAGESLSVILRNLSQEGALVQGDDLPAEGARVLFHRQGLSVPSTVAWSHGGHAGLQFDFPLFPREMLRHVPQSRRPTAPPIKRRPGLQPQPLTPAERMLIERWATECATNLGD